MIQKCREWLPGGPETKMGSFGLSENARYRAVQYVTRKMGWCSAMSFESIGAGSIKMDGRLDEIESQVMFGFRWKVCGSIQ